MAEGTRRRRKDFDKWARELPKKEQRYAEPDPELVGHYVRVTPKGVKTFVAVARDPYGKQVWNKVGRTDVMTIEKARDKAREIINRVKAGEKGIEPPPTKPDTFRAVAEGWLKRHVAAKALRSEAEIRRCLEKYVLPHWAERDFVDIKRSDITRLLDHVQDEHGAVQADRVLAYVRGIANWFASREDDYLSPFTRGMRRTDPKDRARARILTDDELRTIWKKAESNGAYGAFIRLALLTGQRREKLATMKWDDVSVDGTWTIPAEDREKGAGGKLVLPIVAVDIIRSQPRIADNDFVFAGRGGAHMNGWSKAKAAFDENCGVTGWTIHDLRRTARSLMARAGVRPDIAERALGHAIRGVEGVYDRHEYVAEKADALIRLAALIETIINPPSGNVVQLRK